MTAPGALFLALDLAATPILAKAMRRQPLPGDVLGLIRIAAGDTEACRQAAVLAGRSPESVREAAILYLQHVLLAPNADNYRILGVGADAPHERVREHMRWMMKWAHPDRSRSDWESVFAERVLAAWHELKTPERRRHYDRSVGARHVAVRRRGRSRRRAATAAHGPPRVTGPGAKAGPWRARLRRRLGLAGSAVVLPFAALFLANRGLRSRHVRAGRRRDWRAGWGARW